MNVFVLGGLNGTAVEGASLAVHASDGSLVGTYSPDADGKVSLAGVLAEGSSYSITATKSGRAASERLDYVALAGTTIALYCLPISMSGVVAVPPTLVELEYSADGGSSWLSLEAGAKLAAGFEIRAKVAGVVAVEETSMSGFGVKLDLDRMPTTANGFEATSFYNGCKSSLDSDPSSSTYGKYLTDAVFDLSKRSFVSGSHTLELVAYDAACNRLEKRLDFSITSAPSAGSALSSASFSTASLGLVTYDTSSGEEEASCIRSTLSFKFSRQKAILGFDVYRSTDGSGFARVARVNLGELGYDGFSYSDFDPALQIGGTYYYKARAFSSDPGNDAYWADSPVVNASFLAPFTISLTSPDSGSSLSSSDATATSLKFKISNTALWSANVADYFYFSLLIKDKVGDPAFYGEYRYNFSKSRFEAPGSYDRDYGTASWSSVKTPTGLSYDTGIISIVLGTACSSSYDDSYYKTNGLSLTQGSVYEWDVYGSWYGVNYGDVGSSSSMNPPYFEKAGSSTSSSSGMGYAYANDFTGGVGSLNGAYEFYYE